MKIPNAIIKTLLVGMMGVASIAYAVTPANTTITNTAQLNYSGLSSPLSASVDVTIALTPAAPTLSSSTGFPPPDQTVPENQPVSYVYTITANANGNDAYDLDLDSAFGIVNLSSTSVAPVFTQGLATVTQVTLGATAASAVAGIGVSTISVPSDGTANASVNGLIATDTVVIGGDVYTILSISDNGVTASITLTSNLTTAVAIGDLIAEQQTFTATIPDVGTVNPTGSVANVTMVISATSVADPLEATTDETFTTVVEVTFSKYVRNVTNPNGTGSVTINGEAFFNTAGNVSAESGDTLEYALVVTAPATPLNGVSLIDTIPAFTTYVPGSTTLNAVGVADDPVDICPLIAGMDANDAGSASGTVAATETATVTFQVLVE